MKNRRTQVYSVAALAVLLAGCSSAPKRVEVERHLPDLPGNWVAESTAEPVLIVPWWAQFGLESLVDEALQNNRDLRAAAARVEAAVAQARIAGAAYSPSADFTFDAARRQQKFVGLPIPGAPDTVLTSRSTVYGAALNLSWELDLWGRIRAGSQAGIADLQSSEHEYRAAQLSLAAQTVKAWLAALEANRQLNLARATQESYRTTARQVRERYERGIRSPLDVRLALANEATAGAVVAARETQAKAAARQLELLLGRYPAGSIESGSALPALTNTVPAGLPSELLDRRPDLAAAERRLAAATSRVKEAKAALFPRIALTASGGRTSSQLSDLLSNNFNVWAIAGNFAQPIFEGGRLRANVRLNQARLKESAENYASSALRAFSEVESALSNEEALAEREQQLAEAVRQSNAASKLAEERYRSGLGDFITLLETQRRAFENESHLLAVSRARIDNRIDLHLALGGGFPAESAGLAKAQHLEK
jgi:outer membrane protein, multidrug efflux system